MLNFNYSLANMSPAIVNYDTLGENDLAHGAKNSATRESHLSCTENNFGLAKTQNANRASLPCSAKTHPTFMLNFNYSLANMSPAIVNYDTLGENDSAHGAKNPATRESHLSCTENNFGLTKTQNANRAKLPCSVKTHPTFMLNFNYSLANRSPAIVNYDTLGENDLAHVENDPALRENDPTLVENDSLLEENNPALRANNPTLVENDSALRANNPTLVENDSALRANDSAFVENDSQLMETNPRLVEINPTLGETNPASVEIDYFLRVNNNDLLVTNCKPFKINCY